MLKLGNWKKLIKSKKFWISAVVIVLICVIVGVVLGVRSTAYSCTLEDIFNSPKLFPDVWEDAHNKESTDTIVLFVHFDHQPTDGEMHQLQQSGFTVYNWSWTPPQGEYETGFYLGECIVNDICRLGSLEFVKKVTSGEPIPGIPDSGY